MNRLKPIEHKFKAAFFEFFKRYLKKGATEFHPIDCSKIKKVLFIRPEKLGDMVISFPVFDGLKEIYPHLEISILASPVSYSLIKEDSRFKKIYLYHKSLFKDYKTMKEIRKANYDVVVDMIFFDSVTALFLAHLYAKQKPLIGVGKFKYAEYYDFNYDYRNDNKNHIIENTLKLLEAFGIDVTKLERYREPYLNQKAIDKADQFFNKLESKYLSPYVVGYNLSAGSPTREWKQANSINVIRQILDMDKEAILLLFTTPSERKKAESVKAKFNERVELLPEKLNIIDVSAMIKQLDLIISPDTSLIHIARTFKIDVIGLYSRFMKNFLLWKPFDQEFGAVVAKSDDNIHDITPDQVIDVYMKFYQQKQKGISA